MATEQTEAGLTQNGFIQQDKKEAQEEGGASFKSMASEEMNEVYALVFSRFERGMEEVQQLVEQDTKDIKDFKSKQLPFDPDEKALTEMDKLLGSEEDNRAAFTASIPGGSLTGKLKDEEKGTLGAYPWENPAVYDTPTDAFGYILESIEGKKEDIHSVLYAGVPAESIARAITFLGYTEGLFSVDISELLVIPLMFNLVADAQEQGVTARIFNDVDEDEINPQSALDIMEDLKPEEYASLMEDATRQAEEENMVLDELKQDPVIGSFLSMGEQ
jgi:hypothetical protein